MMIKLKHTLFFGLLCMVCMTVFAQNQNQSQEEKIVSFMPYEADQHLILDEFANPQVDSWKITIYEKELNNAGEFVLRSRETINLTDTYYMRIPDHYNNENHFIGVQGMSTSGTILVEKDPFPPVGPGHEHYEQKCYWRCIGKTYAFQITLFESESGGNSQLSFHTIPDETPRYQYMSPAQFNSIGALSGAEKEYFLKYYNVPSWAWTHTEAGIGHHIIRLTGITAEDNLRNASGDVLTDLVYGVRKHLGEWRSASSPIIAGGEGHCAQNINWAIGIINSSEDLDGYPTVKCVGIAYNGEDDVDGTESGGLGSEEALKEIDCFFDAIIDGEIDDSLYAAWLDCMGLGNGGGGIVIDDIIGESVNSITFQPFNGEENDIYVLTNEDFVNQNNELIIPEVNIPEGLNMVKFQLDGGRHDTLFYTANNATSTQGNNTTAQSDALDVTIYEVPITRNKFNITLSVQADRSFNYELYNLSGHLLFQKEYTLQAGQTIQEEIRPTNGIPRGVLINRFRFTDGSEVIEQTLKI